MLKVLRVKHVKLVSFDAALIDIFLFEMIAFWTFELHFHVILVENKVV